MGTRPDLDLSGILTSFDRKWLFPAEKKQDWEVPEQDGFKFPVPQRFGVGPDTWSASTELAVPVVFRWDANGYYRALGVSPLATRRELREAYQRLDGQRSPFLTYAFKQLLNPETRAAYDATPLGQPFFDDYTQRELKSRAKAEARRRSTEGKLVTAGQVVNEWGYVLEDEDERVDTVNPTRQDHPRKAERLEYSYYGWRTTGFLMDEGLLQQWQKVLSTTAAQLGVTPKLSFGITAVSDRPYILEKVGDKTVIFFREGEEPAEAVAREAIETFTEFHSHSRDGVSYDQSR